MFGSSFLSITYRSGGHGIRPPAQDTGKTADSQEGGAQSGARESDSAKTAADLARIVNAWQLLPGFVRRAMVALLDAARSESG